MAQLLSCFEVILLLSVATIYILQCPFNKVEESFNTQALHDIINIFPYRLPFLDRKSQTLFNTSDYNEVTIRSNLHWDHVQFPGVVPRTFIGALSIGLPLRIVNLIASMPGYYQASSSDYHESDSSRQFFLQICSRFFLSSLVVISLTSVNEVIHKRYGISFRICFFLITISQFHYLFYASRFIPNTFATILSNLILASLINRQHGKAILYIAFCVVVFRFDTSLLFGWILIDGIFIKRQYSLKRVLKIGIPAGLLSAMLSLAIDSLMWGRLVLPELEGLYFNLWLNRSSEWGTQPFFWYIYNCIPRILMSSTPLILVSEHRVTREFLLPALTYILTYSFLPHKELRFILFVAPFFNISATSGLLNVYHYVNKLFLYLHSIKKNPTNATVSTKSNIAASLFVLIISGMLLSNMFVCYILTKISSENYPGGDAALLLGTQKELLDRAQQVVNSTTGQETSTVAVYVNNLAAQTGMSRFVQVDGVYYSKTPKIDNTTFKRQYDLIYLLLEPKETGSLRKYCDSYVQNDVYRKDGESWFKAGKEVKCTLPNQAKMFCSMIDTIASFKSVNIGGFIRNLKRIMDSPAADRYEHGEEYIKTRIALLLFRCFDGSEVRP